MAALVGLRPCALLALSDYDRVMAWKWSSFPLNSSDGAHALQAFRIFMLVVFFSLSAYTAVTISNYGWNLIPVFFGDMRAMTWPGQFNFDFMGFLFLSGLWVSWRHQFSVVGIGLGAVAVFGGMLFLSLYLFVASIQANGNLKEVLMGSSRRDN